MKEHVNNDTKLFFVNVFQSFVCFHQSNWNTFSLPDKRRIVAVVSKITNSLSR